MIEECPNPTVQELVALHYPEDADTIGGIPDEVLKELYPEFKFGFAGKEVVAAKTLLQEIISNAGLYALNHSDFADVYQSFVSSMPRGSLRGTILSHPVITDEVYENILYSVDGYGMSNNIRIFYSAIIIKASPDWDATENTKMKEGITLLLDKWEIVQQEYSDWLESRG